MTAPVEIQAAAIVAATHILESKEFCDALKKQLAAKNKGKDVKVEHLIQVLGRRIAQEWVSPTIDDAKD